MSSYEKMCEEAFVYLGHSTIGNVVFRNILEDGSKEYHHHYTQEQLQEIVMKSERMNPVLLMYSFSNWWIKKTGHLPDDTTLTEMWLRYAMRVLYEMVWSDNKENWV